MAMSSSSRSGFSAGTMRSAAAPSDAVPTRLRQAISAHMICSRSMAKRFVIDDQSAQMLSPSLGGKQFGPKRHFKIDSEAAIRRGGRR